MVLYFSATNNSKFVAEYIAEKLNDNLVCMNDIIKNCNNFDFSSNTPFVVVAPIYAWRVPRLVESLLENAKFNGSRDIYFVVTMGGMAGGYCKYLKKITKEKNLNYKGSASVLMPDNYMVSFKMPSKSESINTIKESLASIDKIVECIKGNIELDKEKDNLFGRFLSSFINSCFYKFAIKPKKFTVSDKCIKCEQCIKNCPTNNISLINDKISFEKNCMFCFGCIHKCPTHAIDYKGKGVKNGYYICPTIEEVYGEKGKQ